MYIEDVEKIIKKGGKMKEMLESVYRYNSRFILSDEQEKLLAEILYAIQLLDRKFFVEIPERAYDDNALPIGEGQTISQPSTVTRMLLLSELKKGDSVLEVGAGSGWNATLIALLVYPGNVISVDRINALKEKAEKNLAKLRNYLKQKKPEVVEKLSKINFYAENIFEKGRAWKRKYDKIIFTAGIQSKGDEKGIEKIAKELLKKEGILICPRTMGPLIIYKKQPKLVKYETKEEYVFVPLINDKEAEKSR